jgi:dihydroflavonol-4-reductase
LAVLTKMLDGKVPMVPDAAFPMVDVRDVAQLHVSAIKNRKASGERFIASGKEPISFADAAQILLDEGYKGPSTKKAPRWFLRILAIFDREARGMLALVGMYLTADNSKTMDTFDWTPMPFRQSLIETAVAVQNIRNK